MPRNFHKDYQSIKQLHEIGEINETNGNSIIIVDPQLNYCRLN